VGPLAVRTKPRQRHPTARRPLGTRTLRRDGSYRPQGGFHRHPPVRRGSARAGSPGREGSRKGSSHGFAGGGHSIRRCRGWQDFLLRLGRGVFHPPGGCQRPCLPRPRGPSARPGTGCRWRGLMRTPRGPRTGRAAGSRSRESRSAASGGEQAPSGRAPAGQERKASRSGKKKQAAHPRGKEKPARRQREVLAVLTAKGPSRTASGQETP
jgi:hypothetical protein